LKTDILIVPWSSLFPIATVSMADSATSQLVQAPDGPRVMFLGVGTFVVIVFCILAVLLCVAGRGTSMPVVFYASGTGLVGLVLVLLLVLPRQPAFSSAEDASRLTSSYSIGQGLTAAMALLGVVAGLVGAFQYACMDPVSVWELDEEGLEDF
jgi:hypothetical protein